VVSAIVKKSWGDLWRKKARTIFTLLTIALGVAGISMFALVPLMDRAMEEEISEANIYNVQVNLDDVNLTEMNVQELVDLPNVKAFEARTVFFTKIYVGERRNNAIFVGVKDFREQKVDVVIRNSGDEPTYMKVMTEAANIRSGVFEEKKGDHVSVIKADGSEVDLGITGEARSLLYSSNPNGGIAVFYTTADTVRELGNLTGYNVLSFRLEDTGQSATEQTVEDIRDYLIDPAKLEDPVVAFSTLPDIRKEGTWPGQELFADISMMFYFITFVALFCSIFLISNTMNTIISEQKKEIAFMKAIGATRAQVFRSYLTTSLILGLIGAFVGAALGIGVAVLFINYIGGLFGISPGFMVHFPTVIISLVVGLIVTILASIPALFGALKVTVREGMQDQGISSQFGTGKIDRLLKSASKMPRTVQMGFRNLGRNKKRSVSTMIQVAIAVGVLLGVVAFGTSLFEAVAGEYDNWTFDIRVEGQENGGKPLTMNMSNVLTGMDGVKLVEPFLLSGVEFKGEEFFAFGMPHDTQGFKGKETIVKGDWFTPAQENNRERVVVITEVLTRRMGWGLGDELTFMTATGPETFEVVGVNSALMMNGLSCYFPFGTLQDVLKKGDVVSGFMVMTESKSHDDIDRVSTVIEDEMLAQGFTTHNLVWYVEEELNHQNNQMIGNALYAIGILVVLITLIGLMNTLTMNILDRTKEIGMLRCIGARARDIRRVFASEGFELVFLGWIIGIPAGYLLGRAIWYGMGAAMDIEADFLYPLLNVPIVLVITLIVALLIIQIPLWRATHIRPGDAIRYQ